MVNYPQYNKYIRYVYNFIAIMLAMVYQYKVLSGS